MIVPMLLSFAFLGDGVEIASSSQIGGFTLNALAVSPALVIKTTKGEKGLRFPDAGLELELPSSVETADVRACSFAGTVKVEALSSSGHVSDWAEISGNRCVDLRLRGLNFTQIRFTGGGNEGQIISVNSALVVCEK